jgi:hypothetical protein
MESQRTAAAGPSTRISMRRGLRGAIMGWLCCRARMHRVPGRRDAADAKTPVAAGFRAGTIARMAAARWLANTTWSCWITTTPSLTCSMTAR